VLWVHQIWKKSFLSFKWPVCLGRSTKAKQTKRYVWVLEKNAEKVGYLPIVYGSSHSRGFWRKNPQKIDFFPQNFQKSPKSAICHVTQNTFWFVRGDRHQFLSYKALIEFIQKDFFSRLRKKMNTFTLTPYSILWGVESVRHTRILAGVFWLLFVYLSPSSKFEDCFAEILGCVGYRRLLLIFRFPTCLAFTPRTHTHLLVYLAYV